MQRYIVIDVGLKCDILKARQEPIQVKCFIVR